MFYSACAQLIQITGLEVRACPKGVRSLLPTPICSHQGDSSGAECPCSSFSSGIHFPLGPKQNSGNKIILALLGQEKLVAFLPLGAMVRKGVEVISSLVL